MQVNLYGVRMGVAEGLTPGDMFEFLEPLDGKEFKHRDRDHVMGFDEVRGCHVALFLTVRDHTKFMTMKKDSGKYKVTPQEIEKGSQAVDFNFLAINKVSGRGLYQHYKSSLGMPSLTSILNHQHKELVETKRKEWMEANEGKRKPGALYRESRKQHKGKLNMREIFDDSDVEGFLKELDRLTSFQFELEGISDEQKAFRPFSSGVKATAYTLKFKPKTSVQPFTKKLLSFIEENGKAMRRGVIEGHDGENARSFDLYKPMAKVYGEYHFDDVASDIDPDVFDRHVFLRGMIDVMEKYPQVFAEEPAS